MTTVEPRLDTRRAAAFLTALGFKVTASTLTKLRCIGGGPEFNKFGRRPIYTEQQLLDWASARTQSPMPSASDRAKAA